MSPSSELIRGDEFLRRLGCSAEVLAKYRAGGVRGDHKLRYYPRDGVERVLAILGELEGSDE